MAKKIRRVKRTIRVDCGELAYTDEDGDEFFPRVGQWVDLRKKTSPRDYEIILALAELFDGLKSSGDDEMGADEMVAFFGAMPDAYDMIARKVRAWNWTDLHSDDDEPPDLPLPTLDIIKSLDFETDLGHLVGIVMGGGESEKN